jgi:hypothetical protein
MALKPFIGYYSRCVNSNGTTVYAEALWGHFVQRYYPDRWGTRMRFDCAQNLSQQTHVRKHCDRQMRVLVQCVDESVTKWTWWTASIRGYYLALADLHVIYPTHICK